MCGPETQRSTEDHPELKTRVRLKTHESKNPEQRCHTQLIVGVGLNASVRKEERRTPKVFMKWRSFEPLETMLKRKHVVARIAGVGLDKREARIQRRPEGRDRTDDP